MKKILFSICIISLLFGVYGCGQYVLRGEGAETTSVRTFEAFSKVDVELSMKVLVNVKEGTVPSVAFKGYENLVKHIVTRVEQGTLIITDDLGGHTTIANNNVVAMIMTPAISGLTLRGAHDAEILGPIRGAAFILENSGSGEVHIENVSTDNLVVKFSGAANVRITAGAVKSATYSISGAGDIDVAGVEARNVSASISGSGNIDVWAAQTLDVNVSGAGNVTYKGSPLISKHISGAGSVVAAKP